MPLEPLTFDRESGEWIARIILRGLSTPWAEERFATKDKAEAYLSATAHWFAEVRRQRREESEKRSQGQREEFIARVRARRSEARRRFRNGAGDVVVIDRIPYSRRHFRLPSQPACLRLARQARRRKRSVVTRRARARSPGSSSDSEPEPELEVSVLAVVSARMWAHEQRRLARRRVAA
jgi:hypothetical protein